MANRFHQIGELESRASKARWFMFFCGLAALCKVGVLLISVYEREASITYLTAPLAVGAVLVTASTYDTDRRRLAALREARRPRLVAPYFWATTALLLGAFVWVGVEAGRAEAASAAAIADWQAERAVANSATNALPGSPEAFEQARLERATEGATCDRFFDATVAELDDLPPSCVFESSPTEPRSNSRVRCSRGDWLFYELSGEGREEVWVRGEWEQLWTLTTRGDERDERVAHICRPKAAAFNGEIATGSGHLIVEPNVSSNLVDPETGNTEYLRNVGKALGTTEVSDDRSTVVFVPGTSSGNYGQIGVWQPSKGVDRAILVEDASVVDVALAQGDQEIFFLTADSGMNTIGRVGLDGTETQIIVESEQTLVLIGAGSAGLVYEVRSEDSAFSEYVRLDPTTFVEMARVAVDHEHVIATIIDDGAAVVAIERGGVLRSLALDGSAETTKLAHTTSGAWFHVSDDGSTIAFSRSRNVTDSQLFIVPTDGSAPPSAIDHEEVAGQMVGGVWLHDGSGVVVGVKDETSGIRSLLQIETSSGALASIAARGTPVAFVYVD